MGNKEYDVIVVGGGPAGSTCSLFLANSGLKVLLLEKETFPRDKTCADNKSWICTSIVKELGLWEEFEGLPKQEIIGMVFSSPAGHEMRVPLDEEKIKTDGPHYNVRRLVFDDFLFRAAKKHKNVQVIENFSVQQVIKENDKIVGVEGKQKNSKIDEIFLSNVVVGADGSQSKVAFSAGLDPIVPDRHALCARAYFKNVKYEKNFVELHYLPGICPGYFWIFPVDNGLCNVGVGIQSAVLKKRGQEIDGVLDRIISSENFSARFKDSKKVSPTTIWGVTVGGTKKRTVSGNGFVLCGDAANTAVTFAGEGVGPAMRSGKMAAKTILAAYRANDFSQKFLSKYDDELWGVIGPENKAMSWMELLITRPSLFDFVVKRASKNPRLVQTASLIGTDYKNASKIASFSTLMELLFRS